MRNHATDDPPTCPQGLLRSKKDSPGIGTTLFGGDFGNFGWFRLVSVVGCFGVVLSLVVWFESGLVGVYVEDS